MKKIQKFVNGHKGLVGTGLVTATTALSSVSAFAEGTGATVTAAQVDGLLPSISANLDVLMPVGIGIMGLMIGVRLIPRIVYSFM